VDDLAVDQAGVDPGRPAAPAGDRQRQRHQDVGQLHQPPAAREQAGAEVRQQPEAGHVDVPLVDAAGQRVDLLRSVELHLVGHHEAAVRDGGQQHGVQVGLRSDLQRRAVQPSRLVTRPAPPRSLLVSRTPWRPASVQVCSTCSARVLLPALITPYEKRSSATAAG
jgi:hypothetical protein